MRKKTKPISLSHHYKEIMLSAFAQKLMNGLHPHASYVETIEKYITMTVKYTGHPNNTKSNISSIPVTKYSYS